MAPLACENRRVNPFPPRRLTERASQLKEPGMAFNSSVAIALMRVPHGAPRPGEEECRKALERDRSHLRLPPRPDSGMVLQISGPYSVRIGEDEVDEYLVWER